MRQLCKLIVGTLFTLVGSIAHATIIDFESIPQGNCAYLGSQISTEGFTFRDTSGGGLFSCNAGIIHNGTSSALIAANRTSSLTMFEQFGEVFDLSWFEAGSRTDFRRALGLVVTGTKADSSIIKEVINFSAFSFDRFSLTGDFSNLISVNFLAIGEISSPEFLIDNIAVNESVRVPEPSVFVLFGFGLVGLGLSRKMKKS
jgi:hypothetical protein